MVPVCFLELVKLYYHTFCLSYFDKPRTIQILCACCSHIWSLNIATEFILHHSRLIFSTWVVYYEVTYKNIKYPRSILKIKYVCGYLCSILEYQTFLATSCSKCIFTLVFRERSLIVIESIKKASSNRTNIFMLKQITTSVLGAWIGTLNQIRIHVNGAWFIETNLNRVLLSHLIFFWTT